MYSALVHREPKRENLTISSPKTNDVTNERKNKTKVKDWCQSISDNMLYCNSS